MEHQENVFIGMFWGALLSFPLWAAFFMFLKVLL
mgnify:CR=1 FL=1